MEQEQLKKQVYNYWNQSACGTSAISKKKFTKEYFNEIEQARYAVEPEIFSFAQFTRYRGKKILEVGVGAGTDFLQWVCAGTQAHGIDLTHEAIEHITKRLALYGLKAESLQVADAENLSFEDNSFDLVYSWGVIHHSPDIQKCLEEIIRVTKPGGIIKIMIYNRRSLFAFYQYLIHGLFKGKPFQSFAKILYDHQESLGTRAFTVKEVKKILANYSVSVQILKATVTNHDLLYYKPTIIQFFAYCLACLFGWNRVGWFMTIELIKGEK